MYSSAALYMSLWAMVSSIYISTKPCISTLSLILQRGRIKDGKERNEVEQSKSSPLIGAVSMNCCSP